jgi:NAD-dependent SIR2 family protein deacetylase
LVIEISLYCDAQSKEHKKKLTLHYHTAYIIKFHGSVSTENCLECDTHLELSTRTPQDTVPHVFLCLNAKML